MQDKIKIAMGQMLVVPGKLEENLSRAEKMIEKHPIKGVTSLYCQRTWKWGGHIPEHMNWHILFQVTAAICCVIWQNNRKYILLQG